MDSIAQYLTREHTHCDDLFATAELHVSQADWAAAAETFKAFQDASLDHFGKEEALLFPAFETASGMAGGPTAIMRQEHAQMRDAMQAMAQALTERNAGRFLGLSETLLMLMGQHNLKEEQILYRMCDQTLGNDTRSLIARMDAERAGIHQP